MKKLVFISIFFSSFIGFGQLEFMEKERLLFVGVDSIENKKIISSVYVIPLDSIRLKVKVNILHQWKSVEKFEIELKVDQASVEKNAHQIILKSDTSSAYRFYNDDGYEMLIAKEKHFSYYKQGGTEEQYAYSMSSLQVLLPKEEKHFVSHLPFMHEK